MNDVIRTHGHTPFCIADNYPDQPSDAYNKAVRSVVVSLRGWDYDARFVHERASQNGSITTFTAVATSGSKVVSVSSTVGLRVGDAIYASPGMPQGGIITAIGSGTITLNMPATASGTASSGVSHWSMQTMTAFTLQTRVIHLWFIGHPSCKWIDR